MQTPRDFANQPNGYYNAALGVAGTAIAFPPGAQGILLTASAPVYIGLKATNVLLTFNTTNYGAYSGGPWPITRPSGAPDAAYLHLAAATGTAIVSGFFY